jgi:hypothetical protein
MDAVIVGSVMCTDVWPYRLSEDELTAFLKDRKGPVHGRAISKSEWLEQSGLRTGARRHAPAGKLVRITTPLRNRRPRAGAEG